MNQQPTNSNPSLQPREKRLLFIAGILACLLCFTPPLLRNAQLDNLEAIRLHIAKIDPQWQEFQRRNPGFELVKLFDYTGDDGMFGANGYVPSEEHINKLKQFMQATDPPRPIHLGFVQIVEKQEFAQLTKQKKYPAENQTKENQPIGSSSN